MIKMARLLWALWGIALGVFGLWIILSSSSPLGCADESVDSGQPGQAGETDPYYTERRAAYVGAVRDSVDALDKNLTIVERWIATSQTDQRVASKVGEAVAAIAYEADWWLPDSSPTGVPAGYEEFDRLWLRAMRHYARGADLMTTASDAAMFRQFVRGDRDVRAAWRHLPPEGLGE